MIYENHRVWKLDHSPTLVKPNTLRIGDKIAVYAESSAPEFATVKSIIPVYSAYNLVELIAHANVILYKNSAILCDRGFVMPEKGDLVVCGEAQSRVHCVKNMLTAKRFYSILLDRDAPIIVEDGFVIK